MINLSTLHSSTEQEVFTQASRHLISISEVCSNFPEVSRPVCKYKLELKSGGVLRCAAGCFISDNEYSKDFERNSWPDLVRKGLVPANHSKLIHRLQIIHDKADPADWRENLIKLAKELNLSLHWRNFQHSGKKYD